MSVQARIDNLEKKQHKLNDNIHSAYADHLPDEKIARLKKKRLKLEDELELLKKQEV